MSQSNVLVVIQFQAQPGRGGVLRRELASLIRTVVEQERECVAIRMHQDLDDDTRILLYEEWTSRVAYTGPHMQTPHILAFMEKAPTFVAGPPAITFWTLTDEL